MEWCPPQNCGDVAIEKGAFGSLSTKVAYNLLDYNLLELIFKCRHKSKFKLT